MIEVDIYLKSGQSFKVFVKEITIKKDSDGDFSGMAWVSSALELPHILHLVPDDISAVVATQKDVQADATPPPLPK